MPCLVLVSKGYTTSSPGSVHGSSDGRCVGACCLYNSSLRARKDDAGLSVESRWRFRGRVALQLLGMALFEKLRV